MLRCTEQYITSNRRESLVAIKLIDAPVTDADAGEQTEINSQKNRGRDDTQKAVDGHMEPVVAAWVKAGKPAVESAPTGRLITAKADVGEVKRMLRRAATLHKVAVVLYKDFVRPDGDVNVKYTVQPIPVKPAAAEPKADSAGTATPVADAAKPGKPGK